MLGDEVAGYLAGAGLGLTIGSSGPNGVFATVFPPDAADTATAIIEYGGDMTYDAFGPSLAAPVFERPRFQICCRDESNNTLTCRRLIQNIYKKLRHFAGVMGSTGQVTYGFIQAAYPPFFLKYDESQRVYYACNFMAIKSEST